MDEAMLKSGQFPNVAIEAGTDPAEVMREHGRVDNGVEADNGAEVDTREKLEADAENLLFEFGHYCATSREGLSDDVYVFIGDLTDLLDRQAAITERECMEQATARYIGWDCAECAEGLGKELDARCDPLKKRIVELTAERDQLSRDLTAEHALAVQFEHDNEELTAERDELKKELKHECAEWESERDYANQCEERVKELTAERDKLRDTCNTLRASVAGLKMTVERFKARESGDTRQSG